MAIMFKANISWHLILNNTGIKWHTLQNALEKPIQEKVYLHTLHKGELAKEFEITVEDKKIDVYLMWDKEDTKLLIGCLESKKETEELRDDNE